jgi:predicted N-acetyltransferase YhbS
MSDLIDCLEIYALNEKDRFPLGVRDLYRKTLLEEATYTLVAEKDGRVIASGGLSYLMREDVAALSFGLVHPDHQGSGIGTSLLLARLALLDPQRQPYSVGIAAVEKSFGFYRRFGFRPYTPWQDQHGQKHPSGYLLFFAFEIRRCRKLLAENRIQIPPDQDKIPFQSTNLAA